MKYRILLLLSLFTFSAFPKAPRSTAPSKNSHPSLYSIAKKLQDEVFSFEVKAQDVVDNGKEIKAERNSLINDIDEVMSKIDNGEITYQSNDEIQDIRNRINNLHDKCEENRKIMNDINNRKLAVECKLEENPKLKNLIHMDRLYDKIGEYNDLANDDKYDYNKSKTNGELWDIYNNKANTFFSKKNNLPYYPTSEDSQEEPMPSEEDESK
ncbi:MAG: hypothetical protein Pg6B_09720 [Candidatus Azobacteroides pseudotrichonymphae]|nr:MAG: hypothetical protein Ta2E_12220 [Mycoplasmoidaceae bacterium]GMO37808.1 MAG: hypothetical protein Pg6B_09720 [Candidatus Azobacteroides pseudotrichonymphae]